MKGKPFIPAWLDDAGLSQAEFRLYCHLCRRADNSTGIAWPSYEAMAEACGFSRATINRCLKTLESRSFIAKVGKPFGGSSRYRILPPIASPEALLSANGIKRGTIDDAPIVSPENCNRVSYEPSIVSPEAREGTPLKEHQLRNTTREVSLEGIQFATWFKSSLPPSLNLAKGWQHSFGMAHDDLVRIDKRTTERIRDVSRWARQDPFWSKNFLSPLKLRSRDSNGTQYFDVFAERMKQPSPHPEKQTKAVNLGRRTTQTPSPQL